MFSEPDLPILYRSVLAGILGAVIGMERMAAGVPIRARTIALASMMTAMVMALGMDLYGRESSRIVQGLLTGVGFLGAGIIMHSATGEIRGQTTAACLWVMAGIGLVVGAGRELLGIALTVMIYLLIAFSDAPRITRWVTGHMRLFGETAGDGEAGETPQIT